MHEATLPTGVHVLVKWSVDADTVVSATHVAVTEAYLRVMTKAT